MTNRPSKHSGQTALDESLSEGCWWLIVAGIVVSVIAVFGVMALVRVWMPTKPVEGVVSPVVKSLTDHPTIEQEIEAAIPKMPPGIVGSPAQDLRAEWASSFHRGQKIKHAECDHCEGCGITESEIVAAGGQLNDHHVISVSEIFEKGLDPALIGDPKNFIRLCRNGGHECHFRLGHDPDGPSGPRKPNWSESNPNVRRDAAKALAKTRMGL